MLQETGKIGFELHYFPCISQLASILGERNVSFDPSEPFRRSSFRNRLVVVGPHAVIQLSIPVVGGRSVKSNYGDVKIDHSLTWQRDHFRSLQTVYGNSPYFFAYREELQSLYSIKIDSLFEWNLKCLDWFLRKSKLKSLLEYQIEKTDFHQKFKGKFLPSNYLSKEFGPFVEYSQVFNDKNGFRANLSCLDLLFHLGPSTANIILSLADKQKLISGV